MQSAECRVKESLAGGDLPFQEQYCMIHRRGDPPETNGYRAQKRAAEQIPLRSMANLLRKNRTSPTKNNKILR